MTTDEYCARLHEVVFTASANAAYHQELQARYQRSDKAIRIIVAILALIGVILAVPGFAIPHVDVGWVGFVVAIFSVAMAMVLNIVPVSERAVLHGEMFRAWSALRKDGVLEQHKARNCDEVADHRCERLGELIGDLESLHAMEDPEGDDKLLLRCQEDENERLWGVRTNEEVQKKRIAQESASSAASAVVQ
jgi:hypothetical protein